MKGVIHVPAYWPNPPASEVWRFHYKDTGNTMPDLYAEFKYDPATNSMLYIDYNAKGEWLDTWYMQYDIQRGIIEWRDDYPQTNPWLKAVFGSLKKVVCKEPIWWGNYCNVGEKYENYPTYDFFKSTPPQYGKGTQSFYFEEELPSFKVTDGTVYNDVVTCVYQQSWGSKTAGGRYWFARGVGPVAVQWIAPNPATKELVITSRMDATLTKRKIWDKTTF